MMSPSSMYRKSAKPPCFCNACRGSSAPLIFSGPRNWKLAICCILAACSACKRCISEGSSKPIHGSCLTPAGQPRVHALQPPPIPELSCTPKGRRRLLVVCRRLWALATAPLAQRGTSFDVSTPLPPQSAWEDTETLPRALPSTQSFRSHFSRRLFDSGKWFADVKAVIAPSLSARSRRETHFRKSSPVRMGRTFFFGSTAC